MPRTSKYNKPTDGQLESGVKPWRAGLYIRLSREDGDKEESDSVSNQRALLQAFVALESDIITYDTYIDDGYSGTNFKRPSFIRMMGDVNNHIINCVVVKDMSRLGRNYIEVGQYIETVFPTMNVRFISINDTLDSEKNPHSMNNLLIPFKNIINDEYCRDISNKVRSSLDLKRKQGKFIGSFASYGYMKDPYDHNHLVVDKEAAEVVRGIFSAFIGGTSILGIARKLNMLGVPNPTTYRQKQVQHDKRFYAQTIDALWSDSSVRRILQNELYTGCLIQGKHRVKSYKIRVPVTVSQKDWIIVPGTHEAIVSNDTFARANSLFERDTRTAPNRKQVYILSGFLKCADCGRAMNRKLYSQPTRSYCYYICSTYKKKPKGACTKHTVRSDKVEEVVLITLQKLIDLSVDADALVKPMDNKNGESPCLQKSAISQKEQQKASLERLQLSLYPDWKNGDITRDEYQQLKIDIERQIASINESLSTMRTELSDEDGGGMKSDLLEASSAHHNLDKLTRELLVELVDMVYVHQNGDMTIRFRFADIFQSNNQ